MVRTTTAAAARPTSGGKDGKQWTEEEKAAYIAQQEKAFRNFAKYFAGQSDPKTKIPFLARVIEMDEEPSTQDRGFGPFQGSMVKVELVDKPVAGIRFQTALTDNPDTIKNPDSALNHLYRAATGKSVPISGIFNWDTQEILHESAGGTGRLVLAVIQRGKDRNDGKRGGTWSELKDFQAQVIAPVFEDDEEDNNPQPVATPPAKKPTTRKAAVAATTPDPEDDGDSPFNS